MAYHPMARLSRLEQEVVILAVDRQFVAHVRGLLIRPLESRARAAGHSMIPTKTGAAAAVGLVLPHLNGRLDGMAVRVPTINVSLVDLTCRLKTQASASEVNQALLAAAAESANGILTVNTLPLVSQDFIHNPASSIVDLAHTKVLGGLTKVLSWYDNEWGFSNRMLDTTLSWMAHSDSASGQSAA